ncbi:unnamed protein product [Pleuronectes platessa]|uniref:Uncharacterized protein n=1 Tax=Pleuronectes platessa TaxID=8262 RepID=A0A9N7U8M4_PLEPL|nr:unnamed protein product [Pleuronectes platessa]
MNLKIFILPDTDHQLTTTHHPHPLTRFITGSLGPKLSLTGPPLDATRPRHNLMSPQRKSTETSSDLRSVKANAAGRARLCMHDQPERPPALSELGRQAARPRLSEPTSHRERAAVKSATRSRRQEADHTQRDDLIRKSSSVL